MEAAFDNQRMMKAQDLSKELQSFYKQELKSQFLDLNQTEIKSRFFNSIRNIAFWFLELKFNVPIKNHYNTLFSDSLRINSLKRMGIKHTEDEKKSSEAEKMLDKDAQFFQEIKNCDFLNFLNISPQENSNLLPLDLIPYNDQKFVAITIKKLSKVPVKEFYDMKPPFRLPRFFNNSFITPYSKKHALLAYFLPFETLQQGKVFNIDLLNLVFISPFQIVIFNQNVVYPRIKLQLKNVSKITAESGNLILYILKHETKVASNTELVERVVIELINAKPVEIQLLLREFSSISFQII